MLWRVWRSAESGKRERANKGPVSVRTRQLVVVIHRDRSVVLDQQLEMLQREHAGDDDEEAAGN